MSFKIRGILPADKPRILEIVRATNVFLPHEMPVAEEVMDDYFKDPAGSGYFFYVAEHEGMVAGYVCYGPTPLTQGTWDVYWAAVKPELSGQGIASALFRLAEEDIRRRKGRLILIETSSTPIY